MSVLIKGMEMPKSCPCELVGVGYDLYCSFTSGIPSRMREYRECCEKETRPDWCPIGEVPTPHGRLIDADAFKKYCEEGLKITREMLNPEFLQIAENITRGIIEDIDEQPTIIEAEEGA